MQSFAGCSQTIVELTKDQKLISRVACRPPSGMYVSFQPWFSLYSNVVKKDCDKKICIAVIVDFLFSLFSFCLMNLCALGMHMVP